MGDVSYIKVVSPVQGVRWGIRFPDHYYLVLLPDGQRLWGGKVSEEDYGLLVMLRLRNQLPEEVFRAFRPDTPKPSEQKRSFRRAIKAFFNRNK